MCYQSDNISLPSLIVLFISHCQILKYPTLFQVYNGPGSQKVTYEWKLNWDHYLSSYHDVVVIAVDGRGTGGRGDAFLHSIYRQLGTLEVDDQLAAAK